MEIGKKVVVTTQYRGVFFGTLQMLDVDRAVLTHCRNCVRWGRDVRGFIGLSTVGPIGESRVGPAADRVTLFGVTSISLASPEAIEAWEAEPWK